MRFLFCFKDNGVWSLCEINADLLRAFILYSDMHEMHKEKSKQQVADQEQDERDLQDFRKFPLLPLVNMLLDAEAGGFSDVVELIERQPCKEIDDYMRNRILAFGDVETTTRMYRNQRRHIIQRYTGERQRLSKSVRKDFKKHLSDNRRNFWKARNQLKLSFPIWQ